MKLMQQTKRFLAILLAVIMTLGTAAMPASAENTQGVEPLAKILSFSDYQKWGSDGTDWEALKTQLTELAGSVSAAGITPDYLFFGGDYSCGNSVETSNQGRADVNQILETTWPEAFDFDNMTNVIAVQGNHDPSDTANLTATGAVEFDNFLVYCIREDDFPWSQGSSTALTTVQNTVSTLKIWLDARIEAKETRPIFLTTHVGLHYDIDRGDGNNQYAYLLFDVLNEAGKYLDITYMFGHNHTTGDELVGGSLTCYTKEDSLGVCTETSIADQSGTPAVLNFNYMNYGYAGYIGDITNHPDLAPNNTTNILTTSVLTIYRDKIQVDRYSTEGLVDTYSKSLTRDYYQEVDFGENYTLTYESNGGTEIASISTTASWNVISRTTPVKEDYVFVGWTTVETPDETDTYYQPGTSIYLAENTTLYAQYELEPERFVLTDTVDQGEEYLLVWNTDIDDNTGIKHALSAGGTTTDNVTDIDTSWVSEDHSIIGIPKTDAYDIICWSFETAADGEGYYLKNSNNNKYLYNNDGTLDFSDEPTTAWSFIEGTYGSYLAPTSEQSIWIRYSVGSAYLKIASEINNGAVSIYMQEDIEDSYQPNGTKLADFRFDEEIPEGATSITDSRTGAVAVLHGTTAIENGDEEKDGTALVFNGSDTYLELTNADNTGLLEGKNWEEITVSYDSLTEGGTWTFFAKNDEYDGISGNDRYYLGIMEEAAKVKAETKGGDQFSGAYTQGTWKHVDVVYKENRTLLYIDGVLVEEKTTSWTVADVIGTDSTVWIGKATWGSGEFYKGRMDNLTIYGVEAAEDTEGTLIAKFNFDETIDTTTTELVSETGAIAFFGDTTSNSSQVRDDANGNALVFNGTSAYLTLTKEDGVTGLLSGRDLQEVTVSYDAKSVSGSMWSFFVNNDEHSVGSGYYLGLIHHGSSIDVETKGGSGRGGSNFNKSIDSDTWINVKVVFRDYKTKLYIDGKQVRTADSTWTVNEILGETSTLYIGKSLFDGEFYSGQMDNLEIYVKEKEQTPDPTPTPGPTPTPDPTPNPTPTPTPTQEPWPFVDVEDPDTDPEWYSSSVKGVYEKGIMYGIDKTHFGPELNITRADFAVTLYRIAGAPEVTYTNKFPDVADGFYYSKAIIWASEHGIVAGFEDGKYYPDEKISRQDMLSMLYRYAGKPADKATGDYSHFTDADQVYAYAALSVKWAIAEGLVSGNPDGTLAPQRNITRAEIAVILNKFVG